MEHVPKEDVLQALNDFGHKNDSRIPGVLEKYLQFVAMTGDTVFPWPVIKVLVRRKIEQVLGDFLLISSPESVPLSSNVESFTFPVMKEKILEALEYFSQAPFTIQRLCELMVDPERDYKRIDKLMRAIEKNLLVTTTTSPRRSSSPHSGYASGSLVNGFEDKTNGYYSAYLKESMDTSEPPKHEDIALETQLYFERKGSERNDEQPLEASTSQNLGLDGAQGQQGGSSQENLLQIQLQMREQRLHQREPQVNSNEKIFAGTSAYPGAFQLGSEDNEENKEKISDDSCSNDAPSDAEHTESRDTHQEAEMEQQVPQFGLCEGGESGTSCQNVSSQTPGSTDNKSVKPDAILLLPQENQNSTADAFSKKNDFKESCT